MTSIVSLRRLAAKTAEKAKNHLCYEDVGYWIGKASFAPLQYPAASRFADECADDNLEAIINDIGVTSPELTNTRRKVK